MSVQPLERDRADDRVQFSAATWPDPSQVPQLAALPPEALFDLQIVARVLPFRVSRYVLEELIDWSAAPEDPIFRLVFPSRELLDPDSFETVRRAVVGDAPAAELRQTIRAVRDRLNPHPADQLSLNRPVFEDAQVDGLQHKYPETVLFFPSDGQTCHSYCSFCFRWAQFVREDDWRIAMSDRQLLTDYLAAHPEVSDLLVTGGDAFTLKARRLRFFLEPIVQDGRLSHVRSIRLGTKALTFWPRRFISDPDADELLDVLRWLVASGRHVAVMAHYNHWRELATPVAELAIARLRETGAVIRTQGPLLRGVNDEPSVWARLWRRQVELGMTPYYMFIARDTGPVGHFAVPLDRAWRIHGAAARQVSGLARTVRGPSMSASPGKVEILGVNEIAGRKVFVLRMLQARAPELTYRTFFAEHDPHAIWLDELRPAFASAFPFDAAGPLAPEELS